MSNERGQEHANAATVAVNELMTLLTKDFFGAAIGGSDRLMGQVRSEAHEKLDAVLDRYQKWAQEVFPRTAGKGKGDA